MRPERGFQSTLPLRGATCQSAPGQYWPGISIHAPLTGSDAKVCPVCKRSLISIHAPLTGSDLKTTVTSQFTALFQSTLPLRGATAFWSASAHFYSISIHAPLTGSDEFDGLPIDRLRISIHAPLTGSDLLLYAMYRSRSISIHAPLTGSDESVGSKSWGIHHFNPRSPYGERPYRYRCEDIPRRFQSTLPLRGATMVPPPFGRGHHISIHAPLTGSDPADLPGSRGTPDFNPRSPYGERQSARRRRRAVSDFNPRSPYGERPLPARPRHPEL